MPFLFFIYNDSKIMIPESLSCLKSRYYKVGFLAVGLIYACYKVDKIEQFMRKTLLKVLKFKKGGLYLHNNLPLIISSRSEVKFEVDTLRRKLDEEQMQMLGLDCEWVSTGGRRHPVALLQLAAPDGFCSLFRLSCLKTIPTDLAELLEDKNILKVGVAVVADARYLFADYGVRCAGCLDLRHLAAQVDVVPKGLAGLAHDLLGTELDKSWRVRSSDWEAEVLTPQQIAYASADARIAVDIFNELNYKGLRKNHSLWKRLFWSRKDYWHYSVELWSPYVGLNYKDKPRGGDGGGGATVSARCVKSGNDQMKVMKKHYSTLLHQEHYSNIFLLAPDNQVLSTISQSKADWYLEKQLVDVIDRKTMRLRFEPSKRSNDPDNYYTRPKENRCVVCGCDKDLRRKNIVPLEYRKHFEETIKNHNSHDVLLLCFSCHNRSNMQDWELRERLVAECDAPLAEGENRKLQEVPHLKAVRSAARALYNSRDVLPAKRRVELEDILCKELCVPSEQLTKEFLENLINIECVVESDSYKPHGMTVVQHHRTNGGGIRALERRWRQHFLDTMAPRYLPDKWSVNYERD